MRRGNLQRVGLRKGRKMEVYYYYLDRFLCKAKRLDNREWVIGHLFRSGEKAYLLRGETNGIPNMQEVDTRTLCQCTGRKDKYGNFVWEKDILSGERFVDRGRDGVFLPDKCTVTYSEANSRFDPIGLWQPYYNSIKNYVVIGNIIDNPELQ